MPPWVEGNVPAFAQSPHAEHATLRELVAARVTTNEQHDTPFSHVRFHRFSEPTTFSKACVFGLSLGVVLSGRKDIRVEGTTLRVDASGLLVITQETEYECITVGASHEGPYLGVGVSFCPEAVARALIALTDAGAESSAETARRYGAAPIAYVKGVRVATT